jgi:hypothetical protein
MPSPNDLAARPRCRTIPATIRSPSLPLSQRRCLASRDFLHLAAIEAWQAISSGKPVPRIDPVVLYQEMYEAFRASDGTSLTDQFYCRWEEVASEHGFAVTDECGDLMPEVDDAVTGLVTAAIWFGITTGYLTLAGSYHIPRRFLV